MKTSSLMIENHEQDKWFELLKIVSILIAPFFLIQTWIKSHYKDKASEREAALKLLINEAIDSRVIPLIDKLNATIEKINDTMIEMRKNK